MRPAIRIVLALCAAVPSVSLSTHARSAEPAAAYDPKDLSGAWVQIEGPLRDTEQFTAFQRTLLPPGVEPKRIDPTKAPNGQPTLPLQYTPEFAIINKKFVEEYKAGYPYRTALHCISAGMVQTMLRAPWVEIYAMKGPDRIIFKSALVAAEYRVFMNDKHPADYPVKPELYGHSIGRWEGDTLVIDTENTGAHAVLLETEPQSQSMHIVQRVSRPARDRLVVDFFAEDKRAWLGPIRTRLVYRRDPGLRPNESQCFDDGLGAEPIQPAPE